MARKKRSEKAVMRAVAVEPRPVTPQAPAEVKETLSALCPVCGRAIPHSRAVRVQGVKVGGVGYFEAISWDSGKPFGVASAITGRGSFKDWRYITPVDRPRRGRGIANPPDPPLNLAEWPCRLVLAMLG
ncbi:MAG: hypothetical protein JRD89_10490 [Deltaproteobacteria bacterium]|nr:hypothetical protein [Deltaproteobacteria bacterium]